MPKQKTRKTLYKRFKVTKSGKIIRRRQYARHKRIKKNKKLIRKYKKPFLLNTKQSKKIKSLIKT